MGKGKEGSVEQDFAKNKKVVLRYKRLPLRQPLVCNNKPYKN